MASIIIDLTHYPRIQKQRQQAYGDDVLSAVRILCATNSKNWRIILKQYNLVWVMVNSWFSSTY